MVHVGFASACIVDARACVCVSPRVHRVHSVMALCDYAIAYVSHRFAGYTACIGDASAWSAWLDVAYMRTVAYDYARLRVRGGGVGRRGRRRGGKSCSPSVRASRSARVPLQRRYGVSGAYAPMKRLSCVVSLTYACCRCDGFAVRVVTHDFACVGGGGGRVVSFASLRVVSSRSSVSLLCVHVRGRVDARLRLLRLRDSWVRWYLRYLRMCMFAVR